MRRHAFEALALVGLLVLSIPAAAAGAANEPLRVATLLPFVEEAVHGLPQDRIRVVATVRRSLKTPVPEPLQDLGNAHSPDLEQLMVARADLVVADAAIHGARRDELGRGGGEVLLIDTSSVDGALAGLVQVAERAGLAERMRLDVERTKAELGRVHLERPVSSLTVFAVPGHAMLVTPRTWIGDLLGRLGFEDVTGALEIDGRLGGYVEISDELVAGLQPDWLLIVAHGAPDEVEKAFRRQLERGGAWASVAASTQGRVRVLSPRFFSSHPGLAVPGAARWLVGAVDGHGADAAESAAR